jgi:hypothetical protein
MPGLGFVPYIDKTCSRKKKESYSFGPQRSIRAQRYIRVSGADHWLLVGEKPVRLGLKNLIIFKLVYFELTTVNFS